MSPFLGAAVAGLAGGLVASVAMNVYQGATASLFRQTGGSGESATNKAADSASRATNGRPVTQRHRRAAGSLVHYATGALLGIGYALLVLAWPPAAIGFGAAFGIATALVLDDLVVPVLGWGAWPWRSSVDTLIYSLSAHVVFGVVLEGVRRLVGGWLG